MDQSLKKILQEQHLVIPRAKAFSETMASFQETPARGGITDTVSSVESNTDDGVYRAQYDSTRDSTSLAVVAVVATVNNRDPIDLVPLEFSIDTDALDMLFKRPTIIGEGCTKTAFCYEGFEVTVFGDGFIEADQIDPNEKTPII